MPTQPSQQSSQVWVRRPASPSQNFAFLDRHRRPDRIATVMSPPLVVVIAGPNGAGKSTTAPRLLRSALSVGEFVNADAIAQGLSAFRPETVAFAAGRIMLHRLRALATSRESFGFETTLASRNFGPWLRTLRTEGYRVHVAFLSLPDADLAVARVAGRVRQGGHGVPEDVIRRRFERGLSNFFTQFEPMADSWQMFDNSGTRMRIIATKRYGRAAVISNQDAWQRLREAAR